MPRATKKGTVPAELERVETEVVITEPAQQPAPRRRTSKTTGRKPSTSRSRKTTPEPGEAARNTPPLEADLVKKQLGELAGQLEEMRRQAEEAHRQFLADTQAGSQRVREEVTATEEQLHAVTRMFQEARERLEVLPQQANRLQEQFRQIAARLPAAQQQLQSVEQQAEAARAELAAMEQESQEARQRLDAIRQDMATAETRLASVRGDFEQAEQRLRKVQSQLEVVTQEIHEAKEMVDGVRHGAEEVAAAVEQTSEPAPVGMNGRDRLGVTVDPGVVVKEVMPDSPTIAAGLARGDVINGVNGTPVSTALVLRNLILGMSSGDEITLQVSRCGTPLEMKANLQPRPAGEEAQEGQNGLWVAVEPCVVVAEVSPGSAAEVAGVMPGDLITRVNDTAVSTGEQLRQAIHVLPTNAEARIQLSRGGEMREVKVRLDAPLVEATTNGRVAG